MLELFARQNHKGFILLQCCQQSKKGKKKVEYKLILEEQSEKVGIGAINTPKDESVSSVEQPHAQLQNQI